MIRLMLVGKKGVGKDTVAQIVRDVCGEPVVRRAFADMLKEDTRHIMEYVKRNFDVRGVSFDGEEREVMRPFWQWYGTDFVRRFDPDHWIRRFDQSFGHCVNIIVTDCRFHNEATYGKRNGFVLCRIVGPDWRGDTNAQTARHLSETELEDIGCHTTVRNDGTIDDLRRTIVEDLLPFVRKRAFLRPSPMKK